MAEQGPMSRLLRLFHTVRYLHWRQIWFRLYYRIRPLRVPVVRGATPRAAGLPLTSRGLGDPATEDGRRFFFLGEWGDVATAADWNAPRFTKLWLYNLHYLNDLNAVGAEHRRALNASLVDRWIEDNPPGHGNGWEPYTLSLRLVNLVKWLVCQEKVEARWLDSLATQAGALSRQIEWPILANHLFANGKALAFVGAYLSGRQADRWLRLGLAILDREIPEQFLPDGGHFERSPMYHDALLWDLCDLVNLAEHAQVPALASRRAGWLAALDRGLDWAAGLRHPDGDIAFFNDAAFDVAPSLPALRDYRASLTGAPEMAPTSGENIRHYADSGYAAVDMGPGHRALLDVAPVGPDYQPGHAHADTLSFELSLFGRRVLVNSGTSQYGDGAERLRQRGTAAHNTVSVDGQDSSQVWSGFRVARRARPTLAFIGGDGEGARVCASHDGYRRLPGDNVHRREWRLGAGALRVEDNISGRFGQAIARFYLHPQAHARIDGGTFVIDLQGGSGITSPIRLECQGADSITLETTTWHPAFGRSLPNQCIVAAFSGDAPLVTDITWQDDVERRPV